MSEKIAESESVLGVKISIDKLIVMDDVSGLVDRCDELFLHLRVPHHLPRIKSWEMIMSQTHIFNFFPVLFTVGEY